MHEHEFLMITKYVDQIYIAEIVAAHFSAMAISSTAQLNP